jgi:hypothetical protein
MKQRENIDFHIFYRGVQVLASDCRSLIYEVLTIFKIYDEVGARLSNLQIIIISIYPARGLLLSKFVSHFKALLHKITSRVF